MHIFLYKTTMYVLGFLVVITPVSLLERQGYRNLSAMFALTVSCNKKRSSAVTVTGLHLLLPKAVQHNEVLHHLITAFSFIIAR